MIGKLTEPPSLSESQIERYARQIIVPGVGAEGQVRLCAAEVFVDGHPEGRRIAAQYLRAAGVRVARATNPSTRIECVVLAGADHLPPERVAMLLGSAPCLAWYTLIDGGVRGGLADAEHPLPGALCAAREPLARRTHVAHRIAGADVATTTIAALLGWIKPGQSYELELT
jgi:hypothetical protein